MRLAVAGGLRCLRKIFFAGAAIDERRQTVSGQRGRDGAVALGRPLLGAPSGAGGEDGEFFSHAESASFFAMLASA